MLVPRGKLTTIEQSQALGEKIKYLMLVCNRPVAEIGLWRGGWGGAGGVVGYYNTVAKVVSKICRFMSFNSLLYLRNGFYLRKLGLK